MNTQAIKHALFLILGIIALLTTWPHAIDWMANGGNILDPISFFADAINAGETAAFLSIDMVIAWTVFMIWVVFDAERIGMGKKWGFFFVALSYVGVSFTFPVYLIVRERYIDKHSSTTKA
jgi:hypothetical protein